MDKNRIGKHLACVNSRGEKIKTLPFILVLVFIFSVQFCFADLCFIKARYYQTLAEECGKNGIPFFRALRLLQWESGFNPRKTRFNEWNRTWDYGLAQLNSAYLDWFAEMFNDSKKINPFDGELSIRICVRYLKFLYNETNDWIATFAAYSCGTNRLKQGNMPETAISAINFIFFAY